MTETQPDSPSIARRQLGNTPLQISTLGLGSWNTYAKSIHDTDLVKEIVHRAHQRGINFFDMADSYAGGRAEEMMGSALQGLPREELIISTKTFFPITQESDSGGLSRQRILTRIEKSLDRIGTDYIDLYFCHRFDPNTPLEETIVAMNELIEQGKIRHWGTSEWSSWQIHQAQALAQKAGLIPPLVEQPELNLITQLKFRHDTQPAARRHNLGIVTFSPLASGMLTGKYDDGIPENSRFARVASIKAQLHTAEQRQKVVALKALAESLNCSRAQLSIAWALAQPGVSSVITGASSLEQLTENIGASQLELSPDLLRQLDRLFSPGLYEVGRYRLKQTLKSLLKR